MAPHTLHNTCSDTQEPENHVEYSDTEAYETPDFSLFTGIGRDYLSAGITALGPLGVDAGGIDTTNNAKGQAAKQGDEDGLDQPVLGGGLPGFMPP